MLDGVLDKLINLLPEELRGKARESRKALIAGLGALLSALTLLTSKFGWLIPPDKKKEIAVAITFITAALTWLVPNESA
jgi:hypothetical protein